MLFRITFVTVIDVSEPTFEFWRLSSPFLCDQASYFSHQCHFFCGPGCRDTFWGSAQSAGAGQAGAGVGEGMTGPHVSVPLSNCPHSFFVFVFLSPPACQESLQRQTETAAKQHEESLVGVKKQVRAHRVELEIWSVDQRPKSLVSSLKFQSKIKSLEEEKVRGGQAQTLQRVFYTYLLN